MTEQFVRIQYSRCLVCDWDSIRIWGLTDPGLKDPILHREETGHDDWYGVDRSIRKSLICD